MSMVLDSSATLAWFHAGETTPAIREVFAQLVAGGAWVPSLWRLEVANVLEMNIRRGRYDVAFRDASLADLSQLPIALDLETNRQAWSATLRLAQQHRLTVYDAAYLELAKRRRLPLATLDTALRTASHAEGVLLMGN